MTTTTTTTTAEFYFEIDVYDDEDRILLEKEIYELIANRLIEDECNNRMIHSNISVMVK